MNSSTSHFFEYISSRNKFSCFNLCLIKRNAQSMSAIEPLYKLIGRFNPNCLTKEENILLEADLLIRICEELKEYFRIKHKEYFRLLNFTMEMENAMLERNFICLLIKDIISTEEYTLEGIANYVDTHEDILIEVMTGKNLDPSASLFRRSIELHRSVRCELYQMIVKKIASECFKVA